MKVKNIAAKTQERLSTYCRVRHDLHKILQTALRDNSIDDVYLRCPVETGPAID